MSKEAKWQEVYKVQTAAIAERDKRIAELEYELEKCQFCYDKTLPLAKRIAEFEQALQNIANGDTPWLDGYSETPGECYQKYAASVLGKGIDK